MGLMRKFGINSVKILWDALAEGHIQYESPKTDQSECNWLYETDLEFGMGSKSRTDALSQQSGPDRPRRYSDDVAEGIARNAQGLYRFLLVRCGADESLAEDLMQEVCLQAARTVFPEGEDSQRMDAWLFGVARNVLRRHWRTIVRRRRNLPTVNADLAAELAQTMDQAPLPEDVLHKQDVQEQVMLALTSLSSAEQEILLRYYFDGQSQDEISSAMDISVRAVEGRLYRARQAMRNKLAHLEEETNIG